MKTDLPYKEIDIPELDKVIAELQHYTQTLHPGLSRAVNTTQSVAKAILVDKYVKELQENAGFWRNSYPDVYQDLLDECPTLQKSLQEYGKVVNVAFFCLWQKDSPIHSDDIVMDLQTQRYRMDPAMEEYYDKFPPFPIRTRINIPLFNCEQSSTKWWQPHVDKPPKRNDFRSYQEDECDLINETVLDKTMLIRVDIPHQVVNHSWRFPRMAATISTDKDLTPFMENYERWEDPLGYGY